MSVTGPLIDLEAGPINAALSGEWRRLGLTETTDALTNQLANCTGIRFNCLATTSLQGTSSPLPAKSETVAEAAIESDVPILKDVPYAELVSLNLAGRYTDYSINGIQPGPGSSARTGRSTTA